MLMFLKSACFRFTVLGVPRFYSKNRSVKNTKHHILTMPKEPAHIFQIQKQRIKIKQKSAKYHPGIVTLQILGSGAKGAPRSVYVFSDQSRYLFNCGEGTQRLAHEHKTKLGRLEHIFITQPVWKNIGGLPGTALTIQDVGVPQIVLHGPVGLNEIFPATKRFVVLRDLKIQMADCSENASFMDNVMSVKYVPLLRKQEEKVENGIMDVDIQASVEQSEASTSTRSEKRRSRRRSSSEPRNTEEIIEDNIDYYAHERKRSRNRHRSRSWSRSKRPDSGNATDVEDAGQSIIQSLLDKSRKENISMCYICRLLPRPGALDLEKCVRKGVPPGPLLGKLKNREDVTLPNGTVVKSSDVCEPDDPGPVFIVVDCPSPEYIDSLVTNVEFRKHQKFGESDTEAACMVIHFTPKEVMELPQYKEWMENFIISTSHIPINELNSCMGSVAIHKIQHKLNMLSSDFFPLLADQGTPTLTEVIDSHHNKRQKKSEGMDMENLKINASSKEIEHRQNRRHIGSLTSYHLRPRKGFDSTSQISLDPQEYIEETMSLSEFPDTLKELKQRLTVERANLIIRDFPKILFLGTGSCIPNKTRNTSGILLQTSRSKNILLDCGEGTYGQIVRFFGPEKCDEILTNIDAICISHLHADHHIGLIGLLQGRRRALDKLNIDKGPVYLFAPQQILAWLTLYDRCFEAINDEYFLIPNSEFIINKRTYPEEKRTDILRNLDLSDIRTCFVRHCPNAFGISVIHKTGYKITYSGDTMPCESLIELGKNSDLLIHEATMEDDLEKEAIAKMHSTTSQAIQMGKVMQAKHTILTHFSQRYAKLPRFNDNFTENVSIAFDNMQVRLDELPLVPLLYPALRIMFAEHYGKMENKAVKRQLRAEREASLDRNEILQKKS